VGVQHLGYVEWSLAGRMLREWGMRKVVGARGD
jgi:hypothetical protein